MTRFNVGDKVFLATCHAEPAFVTCPDCAGTCCLTVILGDGTKVSIPCACCDRGFEGSKGALQIWDQRPRAKPMIVRNVDIRIDGKGENVEYRLGDGYIGRPENVFGDEAAALERAKVLAAEYNARELESIKRKEKPANSWAWNVKYYRQQLKEAQRRIDYFTAKLAAVPANRKELDAEAKREAP